MSLSSLRVVVKGLSRRIATTSSSRGEVEAVRSTRESFAETWYVSEGCCVVEDHPDVDAIYQAILDSRDPAEQDRLLQELHFMFRYDLDKVFYVPIAQLNKFHGVAANLEWAPRPDSQMLYREIVIRP